MGRAAALMFLTLIALASAQSPPPVSVRYPKSAAMGSAMVLRWNVVPDPAGDFIDVRVEGARVAWVSVARSSGAMVSSTTGLAVVGLPLATGGQVDRYLMGGYSLGTVTRVTAPTTVMAASVVVEGSATVLSFRRRNVTSDPADGVWSTQPGARTSLIFAIGPPNARALSAHQDRGAVAVQLVDPAPTPSASPSPSQGAAPSASPSVSPSASPSMRPIAERYPFAKQVSSALSMRWNIIPDVLGDWIEFRFTVSRVAWVGVNTARSDDMVSASNGLAVIGQPLTSGGVVDRYKLNGFTMADMLLQPQSVPSLFDTAVEVVGTTTILSFKRRNVTGDARDGVWTTAVGRSTGFNYAMGGSNACSLSLHTSEDHSSVVLAPYFIAPSVSPSPTPSTTPSGTPPPSTSPTPSTSPSPSTTPSTGAPLPSPRPSTTPTASPLATARPTQLPVVERFPRSAVIGPNSVLRWRVEPDPAGDWVDVRVEVAGSTWVGIATAPRRLMVNPLNGLAVVGEPIPNLNLVSRYSLGGLWREAMTLVEENENSTLGQSMAAASVVIEQNSGEVPQTVLSFRRRNVTADPRDGVWNTAPYTPTSFIVAVGYDQWPEFSMHEQDNFASVVLSPGDEPAASPSPAPTRVPNARYPRLLDVPRLGTIRWAVQPASDGLGDWVDVRIESSNTGWIAIAPAPSNRYSMVDPATGLSVVAEPDLAGPRVRRFSITDRSLDGMHEVTGTSAPPTLADASATIEDGRAVLAFRRRNVTTDPRDGVWNTARDVATPFIWATSDWPVMDSVHTADGLAAVTLAPSECNAATTCGGHGVCGAFDACVCSPGYTGVDCGTCVAGLVWNASARGCEAPAAVAASVTLRLTMDISEATNSFQQAFVSELAVALGISAARITHVVFRAGSVVVAFQIEAASASELANAERDGQPRPPTVVEVAALLAAAVADPTSALRLGQATGLVDPTSAPDVSFETSESAFQLFEAFAFRFELTPQLRFAWTVEGTEVHVQVEYDGDGYASIGFAGPSGGMVGGDVVVGLVDNPGGQQVLEYDMDGRTTDAVVVDPSQDLRDTLAGRRLARTSGVPTAVIEFRRLLAPADATDKVVDPNQAVLMQWAVGGSHRGVSLGRHTDFGLVNAVLATGKVTPVVAYPLRAIHGWVMGVAWGFLTPLGILTSRFARHVEPSTGPRVFWFRMHRLLMRLAFALALCGFAIALAMSKDGHFGSLHAKLGLATMILGLWQPISFLWHPRAPTSNEPSPAPPTAVRPESSAARQWAWVHSVGGYAAWLLSSVTVILGLWLIGTTVLETAVTIVVIAGAWFLWLVLQTLRSCGVRALQPKNPTPPQLHSVNVELPGAPMPVSTKMQSATPDEAEDPQPVWLNPIGRPLPSRPSARVLVAPSRGASSFSSRTTV